MILNLVKDSQRTGIIFYKSLENSIKVAAIKSQKNRTCSSVNKGRQPAAACRNR